MPTTPSEKKIPSTAPSAAPEDAPRMSGDTNGFRNNPWNAVPATARAAPTRRAATTRGPRTRSITFSAAGDADDARPTARDQSTSKNSTTVIGKRPTVNATTSPSASAAIATNKPGEAERVMLSHSPRVEYRANCAVNRVQRARAQSARRSESRGKTVRRSHVSACGDLRGTGPDRE